MFDLTGLKPENEQGLIDEWSNLIPLTVFGKFSHSLIFFDFLSLPLLSLKALRLKFDSCRRILLSATQANDEAQGYQHRFEEVANESSSTWFVA